MFLSEKMKLKLLSSLVKTFADEEPTYGQQCMGSMLGNEVYSFQIAYYWSALRRKSIRLHVNSELAPFVSIRKVDLVPSEMPCYIDHDENVLRTAPGLYPDLLTPIDNEEIVVIPGQWRALWVTIEPEGYIKSGNYPVEIAFFENTEDEAVKVVYQLQVINALLPKQKLVHTEWFHTDCLATYYRVPVFSEEHWMRIGQFIQTAVKHGINTILTPLFTPPLDTEIGSERPTVQLVDVIKSNDSFSFCFKKLKRWIDLCISKGVEYFEFSHLFTQWGAKNAPKIIATENGESKRIFGWDTDAGGEEYKLFLSQFLPELKKFIKRNDLEKRCYFHVSDEPKLEHFESYKIASNILQEHLEDYPVIDALSNYEFYKKGVIKNPIPANNHIKEFIENEVPDLWTYYCCSQYKEVSNRFFNMPSARNRIIGMQLYKFKIKGFLHWGFNFWYSVLSRYPVDPYRVTDASYAFPSGDAFLVYPGEDGPIESIRLEVFNEALQDLRALLLLETFIGREAVISILEDGLEEPITFGEYPKDAEWLLAKRKTINSRIAEFV